MMRRSPWPSGNAPPVSTSTRSVQLHAAECWIGQWIARESPIQQGQSGRSVAVQNTAVLFGLSRLEVCDGRVLMMQKASLLRAPLSLSLARAPAITLSDSGTKAVKTGEGSTSWDDTAASAACMSHGKHYAEFTFDKLPRYGAWRSVQVGVIPRHCDPLYAYDDSEVRSGLFDESGVSSGVLDYLSDREYECRREYRYGWCMVDTNGKHDSLEGWEGPSREAAVEGDTIGMLLDCDAGSMTVYKNGRRIGAMKSSILYRRLAQTEEYRWAVTMNTLGQTVRVESKPLPTE